MISSTKGQAPWQSRLCMLSASLLIGASAALGTWFGYQTGSHHHVALGLIFAGAALGGELLKPFAIAAAIDSFKRWDVLKGLACLAVGLTCITYSLASELALSAGSRGDLAAKREAQADGAKSAKGKRDRATTELATLKPSRSVSELEPLVANARPVCRIVVTADSRRTACGPPANLVAELGRAKRRAELEATIATAESKLDGPTTATVKNADPLASAVAHYLTAAGRNTDADDLATWLYLLPVLFLELGSAFGLVVAGSFRPEGSAPQQGVAEQPMHQGLFIQPTSNAAEQPANVVILAPEHSLRTPQLRSARERLLAMVRDENGVLRTGHRALGEALGVSATRAGQLLRDLARDGVLRVRSSKTGSVVTLAPKLISNAAT